MNFFEHAYLLLKEKLYTWFAAGVSMLPNIAVALLILVIFYLLARVLRNISLKLILRFTDNKPVSRLLAGTLALIFGLLGLIITLDIINLDRTITSLLAGAGILGLAFSLAFQDVVANFVSSIIIFTRKPYVTGDIIRSNDFFGRVMKINMRATMLHVPEGQQVIIPNKRIMEQPLVNYTIYGTRRIDISLRIELSVDPERVIQLGKQAIEEKCRLVEGTEIDGFCEEVDSDALIIKFRLWVKFDSQRNFLIAKSDAILAILTKLRSQGISLAMPSQIIRIKQGDH